MKRIVFLFAGLIYSAILLAQAPDSFTYQTVIRNSSGEPISNTDIRFSLSILEGSTEGTPVFSETQLVKSNEFGVCNLKIGTGDDASAMLSSLNWGSNNYFLQISIDETGNTDFTEIGVVELLSVPYSFYSNQSASALKSDSAMVAKSLDEEVLYFTESDTLFAVKDRNGKIVFAVYPDGAEIFVDESAKGSVGGFAVTGRNPTKAGANYILKVTADSTRIFVNDQVKGNIGGFAVTGRNPTKGTDDEYLVITPDSTRIYVNEDVSGSAGFAVTSRNTASGENLQFMDLTPENYFIGHRAGESTQAGIYNIFLGYESGVLNNDGSSNTFIGYNSGASNLTGENNVFLGYQSGYSNTGGHENVFIGYKTGYSNTNGYDNIFIGNLAGELAVGTHSTFIGNEAGKNMTGDDNICIGDRTGYNYYQTNYESFGTVVLGVDAGRNINGQYNAVVGYAAGSSWGGEGTGNYNTYLGTGAGGGGYTSRLGSYNVCIGNEAGNGKTGSNKLYIANGSPTTLIYGEFDNGQVVINGEAADNPSDYNFYVNGTASGDAAWANTSDFRLKKDIITIPNALDKVKELRGVNYKWKDNKELGDKLQMGFIAQEVKDIIPEVVSGSEETQYSMQYAPLTAVLVEAVKEQQSQIDQLKKENEELKQKLNEIIDLLKNQ